MKKIFLIIVLFFIINLNLVALTIKEKIQQDLSKTGVKQEIIDETVKLDKKFGEGFVEEDGDGKRATESKDEWEKLYQKDKRNYVALERLIESYFVTGIPNDPQKKKYVSEYLKMNIPEDRKNFVLGRDFWNCSENKNIKNDDILCVISFILFKISIFTLPPKFNYTACLNLPCAAGVNLEMIYQARVIRGAEAVVDIYDADAVCAAV